MTTAPQLAVAEFDAEFASLLQWRWINAPQGAERIITRDTQAKERPSLVGPMNFNGAHRIQLLGPSELKLFADRNQLDRDRFEYDLADCSDLFVVTDDQRTPRVLTQLAQAAGLAVFESSLPYHEVHKQLRRRLRQRLAEREIIHGVMMDVLGTGVLITGDASVGKSELALELISRGHILVADDAPEFTRIAPGTLESRCPPMLQDFLEVRGLGVLNIARMYGDAHTRARKILRFIVHLKAIHAGTGAHEFHDMLAEVAGDRLAEPNTERLILGEPIPERTIPVAPGRNLAVLVEAAVRDHILRAGGYSATEDLVTRQHRALQMSHGVRES